MNSIALGYITTPNKDSASQIAEILLEENLIACGNVISEAESFFYWKGEPCSAEECVLIIKTQQKNTKEIIARVKEVHEYENPCIVFLPIVDGSEEFLEWVCNN